MRVILTTKHLDSKVHLIGFVFRDLEILTSNYFSYRFGQIHQSSSDFFNRRHAKTESQHILGRNNSFIRITTIARHKHHPLLERVAK